MRTCKKCRKDFPLSQFPQYRPGVGEKASHGFRRHICITCHRIQASWRPSSTSEKKKARGRVIEMRRNYGFETTDYEKLFTSQNGRCAICGVAGDSRQVLRPLNIDHDHTTGVIRGLLCRACNHMLGNAGDNPDRLVAAIEYLLNATARTTAVLGRQFVVRGPLPRVRSADREARTKTKPEASTDAA